MLSRFSVNVSRFFSKIFVSVVILSTSPKSESISSKAVLAIAYKYIAAASFGAPTPLTAPSIFLASSSLVMPFPLGLLALIYSSIHS